MILAWSPEEAARYLETFKMYEYKNADSLKEPVSSDLLTQATEFLSSIKPVNKTDSLTLLTKFSSLRKISESSASDFSSCTGFGPQKCRKLESVFTRDFKCKRMEEE